MKVVHAEQHVLGSHGLTETKAFNIRTNAHAFKLLSSGLYSDKIAAVLREIGCNAADAHTQQGTPDRPITVKLPNRIDNQFYIRDYGPGLSHEDVMNLYTTYFASTKQNSNDYTGAFGLGSKSPFSYTDSFTVVSVHGGVKRTYAAYLDNTGSPTISKLTEEKADADWQHGVQIGFPVKQEDFSNFQTRAQTIYKWFQTTPKIEGASSIIKEQPSFSFPDYDIYPSSVMGAVMGNVFYPIITKNIQGPPLFNFLDLVRGIILKFKIGDISITASREQIEYDPATVKAIQDRLTIVLKHVGDQIANDLRQAVTWEQKCKIKDIANKWKGNNYYGYGRDWANFFKALGYSDWANLAGLMGAGDTPMPGISGKESMCRVVRSSNRYGRSIYDVVTVQDGAAIGSNHSRWNYTTATPYDLRFIPATWVLYGELNLAMTKAKHLLDERKAGQIILFTPDKDRGFTKAQAEAEALSVAKVLGISEVHNLSMVALPPNYINRPKKVAKKKGASPAPLPNVKVDVVTDKAASELITALKPDFHNFMVISKGTGYGRSNEMRVYEKSYDQDTVFTMQDWDQIWRDFRVISKQVKTPISGYVVTYAQDAKKLELLQRGWKTTYRAIEDWMKEASTRDAIEKAAQNWRPAVELDNARFDTWALGLIHLRHFLHTEYDLIKAVLKKYNLHDSIELIHDSSVKFKGQGRKEPAILEAYRNLATWFQLPAIVLKKGGYLSLEDFENDLRSKYPLTQTIGFAEFKHILVEHPGKAEGFLKLILG